MSTPSSGPERIDPRDLEVRETVQGPWGHERYTVKLTHVPSGHTAASGSHKSRLQAMTEAMENLRESFDE